MKWVGSVDRRYLQLANMNVLAVMELGIQSMDYPPACVHMRKKNSISFVLDIEFVYRNGIFFCKIKITTNMEWDRNKTNAVYPLVRVVLPEIVGIRKCRDTKCWITKNIWHVWGKFSLF